MPKTTLIQMDMWPEIQAKVKTAIIKKQKMPLKVVVQLDSKAQTALDLDPLLQQQMVDAINQERAKTTKLVINALKEYDAAALKAYDVKTQKAVVANFEAVVRGFTSTLESNGQAAVEGVWKAFTKTNRAYKKYKIKAAFDVLWKVAGIVYAVIGAITSAGIALVVSIVLIFKDVVGLAKQIVKLALEAEKIQKKIISDLRNLKIMYAKEDRKSGV